MKHKNTTITFHQHRHKKIVHKKILKYQIPVLMKVS